MWKLGVCHVRVPTWLPCRLQICLNGHNWLAGQLRKLGIDYRMADNALSPWASRENRPLTSKTVPAWALFDGVRKAFGINTDTFCTELVLTAVHPAGMLGTCKRRSHTSESPAKVR